MHASPTSLSEEGGPAGGTKEDPPVVVQFDGGSRGNPGNAGAGAVLFHPSGAKMFEAAQPIGVATNNVAEYRALILGLKVAKLLGATNLMVYGDSKLVCNQMKGEWAVRNAGLRSLHREARFIASSFDSFDIQYISREKNSMADSLANKAMDGQSAGLDILAKWEGMSRMQKPLRGNAHSTSKQVQSSLEQSIDRRNDGSRPRGSNCKRARPVLGAGSSRIMGGDVPAHNLGMKAKKYSRSILRGGINLFSRRAPC